MRVQNAAAVTRSADAQEPILGEFPFYSGKAARLQQANKGRCIAFLYVMHVAEELASWPERDKRTRLWVRAPWERMFVLRVAYVQSILSVKSADACCRFQCAVFAGGGAPVVSA